MNGAMHLPTKVACSLLGPHELFISLPSFISRVMLVDVLIYMKNE